MAWRLKQIFLQRSEKEMENQDNRIKDVHLKTANQLGQHHRVTLTHQVGQNWWELKVRCGAKQKRYSLVASLLACEELLRVGMSHRKGAGWLSER